jgi:transposase
MIFGEFKNPRVYLKLGRTDFRKSVNGLSVLIQAELNLDPLDGSLFVFCNKSRNRLKILYYDLNGFCLWYKRLEEDKFRWPRDNSEVVNITAEELTWLLRGLDFRSAHRERRYAGVA